MNIGLPLLEADILHEVDGGSEIEVDLKEGKIAIGPRTFASRPPPPFMLEILGEGGLINYLRRKRVERV
jgi:3-isopropylmalate dehydratase small subunit